MSALFATVLTILSVFLILLVLVQRGRGGGLTGALGGMGGSSAFGAKAGDVFTRITIVVAAIWIGVCVAAVYWANNRGDRLSGADAGSLPIGLPADVDSDAGATDEQAAPSGDADSTGGPASPAATAPADAKNNASDQPADESN